MLNDDLKCEIYKENIKILIKNARKYKIGKACLLAGKIQLPWKCQIAWTKKCFMKSLPDKV